MNDLFFRTPTSNNSNNNSNQTTSNNLATLLASLGGTLNVSNFSSIGSNQPVLSLNSILMMLSLHSAATSVSQQEDSFPEDASENFLNHLILSQILLIISLNPELIVLTQLQEQSNPNQTSNVINNNNNNQTNVNHTKYTDLGLSEDLIPSKYLCPILGTIMDNPVYDAVTKNRVEQVTMVKALNTYPYNRNPFNRQPLTVDQLISDDLLAKRIKDFIEIVTAEEKTIKAMDEEQRKKHINEIEAILDRRDSAIVPVNSSKEQSKIDQELTYIKKDIENFISKYGSPYKILGISSEASSRGIESAYRKKALTSHTDKNTNIPTTLFIIQTKAKNLLVDQEKRALVDQHLESMAESNDNQQQPSSKSCRIM